MCDRKLRLAISRARKAHLVLPIVLLVVVVLLHLRLSSVWRTPDLHGEDDDVRTILCLSAPTHDNHDDAHSLFRSCPSGSNRCRLVFSEDLTSTANPDAVLVFGRAGEGAREGAGEGAGAAAGGGGARVEGGEGLAGEVRGGGVEALEKVAAGEAGGGGGVEAAAGGDAGAGIVGEGVGIVGAGGVGAGEGDVAARVVGEAGARVSAGVGEKGLAEAAGRVDEEAEVAAAGVKAEAGAGVAEAAVVGEANGAGIEIGGDDAAGGGRTLGKARGVEDSGTLIGRKKRNTRAISKGLKSHGAYAVPDGMVAWGKDGIKTLSRCEVFTFTSPPWDDVEVYVTRHTSLSPSDLHYDKRVWSSDFGSDPDVDDPELSRREHPFPSRPTAPQPLPVDLIALASTKNKAMAVVLNDCSNAEQLLGFVAKLKGHMRVEVFGQCGQACPESCMRQVSLEFSFYLVVDHAGCWKVHTEDFPRHLQANLVPVVLGGRDSFGDHPRLSFVPADAFPSVQTLAENLVALASSRSSYAEMLRVRKAFVAYEEIEPDSRFYCIVCDTLFGGKNFGVLKKKQPNPVYRSKCPDEW